MPSLNTNIILAGCALHDAENLLQPGLDVCYETRGDEPGTPDINTWGWRARFLTDGTETGSEAFASGTREDGPDAALSMLLAVLHGALRARMDALSATLKATGGV